MKIADFGRAKFVPAAFEHGGEDVFDAISATCAAPHVGGGGEAAAYGHGRGGSHKGDYTCQVVLLQFRAPELLAGASSYGSGVDIWAAGGVIAEMILKPAPGDPPSQFFTSDQSGNGMPECGDARQLSRILEVLGVPEDRCRGGVPLCLFLCPLFLSRIWTALVYSRFPLSEEARRSCCLC